MKILVIGLGSPHGDDQIGWMLIDELRNRFPVSERLTLFKSKGNGCDWYPYVKGQQRIIFIDAVFSGQVSGSLCHFDFGEQDIIPPPLKFSSHVINLVDSIKLARNLNYLCGGVAYFGIDIEQDTPLAGLSPELKNRFPEIVEEICNRIGFDVLQEH